MDEGTSKGKKPMNDQWFDDTAEDINLSDDGVPEKEGSLEKEGIEFVYGTDCLIDTEDHNLKHWVPRCPTDMKPNVGKKINSVIEAELFYKAYAEAVGFKARLGSSHRFPRSVIIKDKYFVCTRAGNKNTSNNTGKRKTTSNRIECGAKIQIKSEDGGQSYNITKFVEMHTHDMVPEGAKHMLQRNRKMDIGHQKFMMSCAKANLGPVKSFNLLKEIIGGYGNVGAMARDFRNFKRDLMANITAADAQMVIDRFKKKREQCNAFYFEYEVNDLQQLTKLFWADPVSRRNYAAFGDVVSFDSTYRTNRYCMVFAPFTGIDNHKKSVTFGAGLVMKEDVPSYEWLFKHFSKAMGHDPKIIVTDQDVAMKIAIENVLPKTRHRLCMWHIMEKLSKKVGVKKINSGDFRKRLGKLVWDDNQTILEFEEGWMKFLAGEEFKNKKWFEDMYDLRTYWIPVYFNDIVLGGLVSTTSISESQNSLFGSHSNRNFTLVELLMQFDSAMETQRYNQMRNDVDSDTRSHDLKTPLAIEKHASEVYTLKVFSLVQEEITTGCFHCSVTKETQAEDKLMYTVREDGSEDLFQVDHPWGGLLTTCSCFKFNKTGLPCRHIFTALKCYGCKEIPECLILDRWRKGAARRAKSIMPNDLWDDCVRIEESKSMMNELWSVIYSCVGYVEDDISKITDMLNTLKLKKEAYSTMDNEVVREEEIRDSMIESFGGTSVPVEIEVQPPAIAKNKGSGKRLQDGKEKAMKEQKKGSRKCKRCNKYAGHDSRNCKEDI